MIHRLEKAQIKPVFKFRTDSNIPRNKRDFALQYEAYLVNSDMGTA